MKTTPTALNALIAATLARLQKATDDVQRTELRQTLNALYAQRNNS